MADDKTAAERAAEFDRWLVRHDDLIRAETLEAFADEIGPWTLASETSNVARARAAEYRRKAAEQ